MEEMQSQWDGAVDSNAVEVRRLKAAASQAAEVRGEATAALDRKRTAIESEAQALSSLSATRRGLAEEEAALRKRYVALRQRRLAKLKQGGAGRPFPAAPVDLEEVAEVAGANAEKAAAALLRFFSSDKAGDGKEPPAMG